MSPLFPQNILKAFLLITQLAAVKLLRLQHETLDVLMRYRRKGEQRVIVQHVNVNDGGKAIVGHFQSGGGEKIENERGTP